MMPACYIHRAVCISPQETHPNVNLGHLHGAIDGKMKVLEPAYDGVPPGLLRRMSRSVRLGIGAALPLLKDVPSPAGIIIGSANAGLEDCFNFLKQIVDFDEGMLTPGGFVQSTPNALAAQLGMIHHNNAYNMTHVHLGHAFENALTDAAMLVAEDPSAQYLVGGVDDLAVYNYTLNKLGGWFRNEPIDNHHLYDIDAPGSIAGEGAAMFLVDGKPQSALARAYAPLLIHSNHQALVQQRLRAYLNNFGSSDEEIDLLVSGENGDNRFRGYFETCERMLPAAGVIRFKHASGEYPTAAAMALWIAACLAKSDIPLHMIKRALRPGEPRNILIYNNFRGLQHAFMLVQKLD